MSLKLRCWELVQEAFWIHLMNGVGNMFTWHEPNQTWWGWGKEIYLHTRSCANKYQGHVDNYQEYMAQHLSRCSDHLTRQCHIELLLFTRLDEVLHNTEHSSHVLTCQSTEMNVSLMSYHQKDINRKCPHLTLTWQRLYGLSW